MPNSLSKYKYKGCGFENVATYINSGNLAFDTTSDSEERLLVELAEQAIETNFGKNIPVMIREQSAIDIIIANNPFEGEFESHKEMHVLFMKGEMPPEKQQQLMAQQTPDERFSVRGREIYCHLRLGVADSLLGKGFIDKKLKVAVTGRNWRTTEMLASL